MKRKFILIFCAAFILTGFFSCKDDNKNLDVTGKTYIYEKEGFGTAFEIHFLDGNKFVYYEGALSSYIGSGTWKINGNILTMIDGPEDNEEPHFKNNFIVEKNRIIWKEKDSTNFLYLRISDGDSFFESDDPHQKEWLETFSDN